MIHNFYKTKLIFQVGNCIAQHRQRALRDLVSAPNNVGLVQQRIRMLGYLSQYEQKFLEKISKFESACAEDYNIFHIINDEIQAVADVGL